MKQIVRFMTILTLGLASPAMAENCINHDKVKEILAAKYHEYPASVGLIGTSNMIEVFASKEGTWTIIVTDADHSSCIKAAGQGWQMIAPEKQGDPT